MLYALHEALTLIIEEGVEQRWERHKRAHLQFIKGTEALGLQMHVPEERDRIVNLNTPCVPPGVDDAKVRSILVQEHGIDIAGGFGPLAGKVFRVGIMGPLAVEEQVAVLLQHWGDALEKVGYDAVTPAAIR